MTVIKFISLIVSLSMPVYAQDSLSTIWNLNRADSIGEYKTIALTEYPSVTSAIRELWKESPYYQSSAKIKDENNFRAAAIMLVQWIDKNDRYYTFDGAYLDRPAMAVRELIFEALAFDFGNQDPTMVTTGWISSEKMFNYRIPTYLSKKGMRY